MGIMDHRHDHRHDQRLGHSDAGSTLRRLAWTAWLNATLAVAQVVIGIRSGSVAVLADAVHQCVDVVGLLLALLAVVAVSRRPTVRRTFGWTRSDPLAAQLSMVLLSGSLVWLTWESIDRLRAPRPIDSAWVIAIGAIGLVVNTAGALALGAGGHTHGHGLSMQAARLHLLGDAAGSGVVVGAGVVTALGGSQRVDPTASLIVCALIAWSAFGLLRRSSDELLDAVPVGIDLGKLTDELAALDGVEGVHHVHVWSLGAGHRAISAHLDVDGRRTTHETAVVVEAAQVLVRDRHGISHATFQAECHTCAEPTH